MGSSKQSALHESPDQTSTVQPNSVEEALAQASQSKCDGHLDAAEALYQYILKEDPQNAEAQKALHNLRKNKKKPAHKGGQRRKQKNRRDPDTTSVLNIRAARPKRIPKQADVQAIIALYNAGRLVEAEAKALKLVRKFPGAFAVYNLLGVARTGLGEFDKAVASYRKAIEVKPDFVDAYNNLGVLYRQYGLLEQAGACYREVLKVDSDIPEAHNNLGNVLKDLLQLTEAVSCYEQALKIQPDYAEAHRNLGNTLKDLGRFTESVASYITALRIEPESAVALLGFAGALQYVSGIDLPAYTRDLIILCFNKPEVGSDSVWSTSQEILKSELRIFMDSKSATPHDLVNLDPATVELLVTHLKKALIADPELEVFLGGIRGKFLGMWTKGGQGAPIKTTELGLLEALANQGFLNEHVWHVTQDENSNLDALEAEIAGAIQGGGAPSEFVLYLLAAYRPVYAIERIRCWALEHHRDADARLKNFLEYVILGPEREVEIGQRIERLTSIEDGVSTAVRSQYEENPYPRWDSISFNAPSPYLGLIISSLAPYRPALEPTCTAPNILIAGCGTGRHPISSALSVQNSNVLAVDLSQTSLAYAKRKAEELNVRNIRFAQADILKLGELEERFDIIECGGVLHHMADPEAGLKVLLERLKPGGFLRLGLYSELARENIVRLRQLVSDEGFEPTLQGIRAFRHFARMSQNPHAIDLQRAYDFYALSGVRDLVFHVQEHRFTIPRISKMIDDNDLEFLGFTGKTTSQKVAYSKLFPDDPDFLNLENWHLFEQANPRMFAGMYQFWCRKGV